LCNHPLFSPLVKPLCGRCSTFLFLSLSLISVIHISLLMSRLFFAILRSLVENFFFLMNIGKLGIFFPFRNTSDLVWNLDL